MAVIADLDALDLWVEPHHLTPEESDEIWRFIQRYRKEHPLIDSEKEAIQTLARSLRGQTGSGRTENPDPQP